MVAVVEQLLGAVAVKDVAAYALRADASRREEGRLLLCALRRRRPSFTAYYWVEADAAFLCVDLARQRHGLIAVAPPKGKTSQYFQNRKSIKGLSQILTSEVLVD